MIAAIVLAAGASRRLGEPKQLVRLGGEPLIERAVHTARAAGCKPVVVVLGAAFPEILAKCALGDAVTVINDAWSEGLASSIRHGITTLAPIANDIEGAVVMTCDQPAVTSQHLQALCATGSLTASEYAGRRGVPAYFPADAFARLMELRGDTGARDLLRDAPAVDLANGQLDVDTPEDVDEAQRLHATGHLERTLDRPLPSPPRSDS